MADFNLISGFLKKPISNRKAKKKKSKGGKEDGEEGKEMGSDGEERRSETPTPEHGDLLEDSSGTGGAGGSYRETPPSISLPGPASDPWADFNQPASRKNFYSSSDRCLHLSNTFFLDFLLCLASAGL